MTAPVMTPAPGYPALFAAAVRRLCRPVRRHVARPAHGTALLGWGLVVLILLAFIHLVDEPVSKTLRALPPPISWFFALITDIGLAGVTLWPSGLGIVAGLLVLSRRKRPWTFPSRLLGAVLLRLSFVFIAVAGSGLIVTAVKRVFGRPRPWAEPVNAATFEFFTLKSQYVSFPSGHATAIAAGCVALALLFPRARGFLAVLALLVAVSRIVVGAHFPADILAGAAFGTAFTLGTWRWYAARALIFPASGALQSTASTGRIVSRLVSGGQRQR